MSSPNQPLTRICLFAGATAGVSPAHLAAAISLAHAMHASKLQLIYGGGTSGLMGAVARTLVSLSGPSSVIGVIPTSHIARERTSTPEAAVSTATELLNIPPTWTVRTGTDDSRAKLALEEEYGPVTVVADLQARKKYMMELVRDGGPGSG
ncbi:MAG: hypothetical protein Q9173_004492, partial [Seirophora scorigena]